MSYKIKRKTLGNRLLIGSVMVAASFGVFSCSDKYDLDSDDNQPSNLNSIYGYLEGMGNYTTYLRLINDLGEKDVLSQTGSNTLFAADDDAFARFFASNKWKVSSYESLSLAQKKLLLYSSMIDNPYSTSMLSTADGPVKGEVFRRSSSSTIYDSVLVVPNSDPDGIMPKTPQFDELKASKTRTSTVLFSDYVQPNPMLHFNAQFMTSNKVMSSDVDFIYGKWLGMGERSVDDVYVNNTKLVEPNIFCKNGFVHRVSDVLMPLDNMAEAIRQNPNTHLFSSILERFASVEYSSSLTDAYNNNKGTSYDSVFVKRYFSKRSYGSSASGDVAFESDKNSNTSDGSLTFDPGWNGLYPPITPKGSNPMMEDMVVMLVPTDAALEKWWGEDGSGSDIRKFYASGVNGTEEGLNKVPLAVLDDLVNAGMKYPFTTTIPSNFSNVLDDASMKLGIEEKDIESVILASNGLIYLTNKVFAPTAYSSVLSPVVIDTLSYSTIANAINLLDYEAYLNSMVSEYTFLLPTNEAMRSYIDPVSYYYRNPQMWIFSINPNEVESKRLSAAIFNCSIDENGVSTPTTTRAAATLTGAKENQYVKNRLEEILDNLIITEKYKPTKQYYRTKGNTFVHIANSSIGSGYDVSATYQNQYNKPVKVITDSVYTKNNGYTYVVDQIPMGGSNSVAQSLNLHPEVFSDFIWVLENSGALSKTNSKDKWLAADQTNGNLLNIKDKGRIGAEDATSTSKVTYLLNNYHYTLYAPTNNAMQQAFEAGLPGPAELEEAERLDSLENIGNDLSSHADSIREVLLDFVKYHIQDNAIFVDEGFASGNYESGKTELIKSTTVDENTGEKTWDGTYSPGRPYKLSVNVSSSGLTVTDVNGNLRNVITTPGMYNIMAREYWSEGTSTTANPYAVKLNNSSFVVIHAIDGPLFFDAPSQFKYEYKKLYQDTSAKRR